MPAHSRALVINHTVLERRDHSHAYFISVTLTIVRTLRTARVIAIETDVRLLVVAADIKPESEEVAVDVVVALLSVDSDPLLSVTQDSEDIRLELEEVAPAVIWLETERSPRRTSSVRCSACT